MSSNPVHTALPKLRFPEFRNAPEWGNERFENLYSFKGTNLLSRDKLTMEKGTVKNIHYGDIHMKLSAHFNIETEEVPYIIDSASLEQIKQENYCQEGDVIFADASEDIDGAGKCIEIVSLGNERLLSGMHTILARQKHAHLVSGFAGHLFQSYKIRDQIQKESQGTKVLGISSSRLSRIDVCFPIPKEQRKIADCLFSVDDLIAKQQQKLKAFQDHKKGLLQQLFPAEGKTIPKLRFPEFRNAPEWEEEKLGKICKFVRGPFGGALKKEIFVKEGYAVYEQSHAIRNYFDSFRYFIDSEKYNSLKRFAVAPNDLIMSCSGTMGKFAIISQNAKKGVINQALLKLTIKNGYNTQFIKISLELTLNQEQILSQSGGGAIKNVASVTQIKEINLCTAQMKEQRKIADCLSSIDILIAVQSQRIAVLLNHKKGLMQQLFPSHEEVMG